MQIDLNPITLVHKFISGIYTFALTLKLHLLYSMSIRAIPSCLYYSLWPFVSFWESPVCLSHSSKLDFAHDSHFPSTRTCHALIASAHLTWSLSTSCQFALQWLQYQTVSSLPMVARHLGVESPRIALEIRQLAISTSVEQGKQGLGYMFHVVRKHEHSREPNAREESRMPFHLLSLWMVPDACRSSHVNNGPSPVQVWPHMLHRLSLTLRELWMPSELNLRILSPT